MSQAEALLASVSDAVPEHEHPVTDPDGYFVIDPDTRVIEPVGDNENFLMQYDHDSERYTFETPRFVEGHDMSSCNRVRVHFNNIDEQTKRSHADVAELNDLAINPEDPSTVICSWLISRQATQFAGILSFLVQYMCVDDDGTVVYEWHTDIYSDVRVKPGRNNSTAAVIGYTNLLEDWYQQLFGSKDSVIADIAAESAAIKESIELKGTETLESIPDDYTELYNAANNALRTRANAVVCESSGNPLVIADTSDDYLRNFKLFGKTTQDGTPSPSNYVALTNVPENINVTVAGKNLFNIPENYSYSSTQEFKVNLPAGTYILSWNRTTKGGENSPWIRFSNNDKWYELGESGKSIELPFTKTETVIYMYSNGPNATASVGVTSIVENLMISVAGGDYESYKTAQTVAVQLPEPLRGIPVAIDGNYTDSNGQQWICDEVDFKRGVYARRIKVINGTDIAWVLGKENDTADGRIYYFPIESIVDGGMSDRFRNKEYAVWETLLVGEMIMYNDAATNYLVICVDKSINTITSLNNWFASNPTQFIYIPATPTETPLSEDKSIQFKMVHTNFPCTTVLNDAGAGMKVSYNADNKGYIDKTILQFVDESITQAEIQAAVDVWLEAHYSSAEGASF